MIIAKNGICLSDIAFMRPAASIRVIFCNFGFTNNVKTVSRCPRKFRAMVGNRKKVTDRNMAVFLSYVKNAS